MIMLILLLTYPINPVLHPEDSFLLWIIVPVVTRGLTHKVIVNEPFASPKKLNDGVITEISKLTYDDYAGSKIDQNLYKTIRVKWVISGKLETTQTNGITTVSVAEQNRNMLISAEQKFPGISVKLNNLLEFYTNTEFKVPADIN